MYLPSLPKNTKDLLDFLRNLQNRDPQELISIYTQSLTLLTDDIHSLFIFLDYTSLALSTSEIEGTREETLAEVDQLFNLFKVKLRKFRIFWISYLKFQVESREKDFEVSFAKIVEYLKHKSFEGKDELMASLLDEKESLASQISRKAYSKCVSNVPLRLKVNSLHNSGTSPGNAPTGMLLESRSTNEKIDVAKSVRKASAAHSSEIINAEGSRQVVISGGRVDLNEISASLNDTTVSVPTSELLSSNIFTDVPSENTNNERIKDAGECNKTIEPKQPGPGLKVSFHNKTIIENTSRVVNGSTFSTKNLLSTPSGAKTWSDTEKNEHNIVQTDKLRHPTVRGFSEPQDKRASPPVNESLVSKDNMHNLETQGSIVCELDLSRSQDTSRLRFSPKKHAPYRNDPEKLTKFKDVCSSLSHELKAGDNTTTIIQNLALMPFKDKELYIINRIGKGGYSNVYKVCYNNEIYALKQIKVDDKEGLNICMDEIDLLKRLNNCEFVIKMVDYEIEDDTVSILLEYGETDLQNLIKSGPLNIFYIKYLWESILKILVVIHSHRIVHRDIKPANFVLVKGKLKIIDFGISKSIKGDTTSILNFEKAGTLNYISPEQCCGGKVSRATDVWAAGCILYYMTYGKNIHKSRTVVDVLRTMAEEADIEYGPADALVIESMKACLVYDSKKRAKPEELLRYSFLQK